MAKSTFRRFVPGLAMVLAFSIPAPAQFLLDDLEHGANRNEIGGYWYMYVSGYGTTAATHNTVVTNFGNPFVPYAETESNKTAALAFTGLTVPATTAYASIGVGTNLTEGASTPVGNSFAGVTGVSFRAKGPANLTFRFTVKTPENDDALGAAANQNPHAIAITIPATGGDTWETYTVSFSDATFGQEDWGTAYAFDPARATQFEWQIQANANRTPVVSSGTLHIDDVKILGTYTPPDIDDPVTPPAGVCTQCVNSVFNIPQPFALLSSFDKNPSLRNELGYFWYAYDDRTDGTSVASTATAVVGRLAAGIADSAVSATVTLGTAFGTDNIAPFGGIGTSLYDDKPSASAPTYFDASDFDVPDGGIYFEYKTANTANIIVELHDKYSAENPIGQDFQITLPGTDGEWLRAVIKFSQFKLPEWAPIRSLDMNNLAKIHILYKGTGGGAITVDNVYLLGSDKPLANVTPPTMITIKYVAGAGGMIEEKETAVGVPGPELTLVRESGKPGPMVEAAADPGYKFVKWSDGRTTATRSDIFTEDTTYTAEFVQVSATVRYTAGLGGSLTTAGAPDVFEFKLPGGGLFNGPAITAVPDEGYEFVGWSDEKTEVARADNISFGVLQADTLVIFNAMFVKIDDDLDPDLTYYNLTYAAGAGGRVAIADDTTSVAFLSITIPVAADSLGLVATAIPDSGYVFKGWSDGVETAARADTAVKNSIVTALFEKIPVSVNEADRVIPPSGKDESAIVAPVAVTAGLLTAGPNPVAKRSSVSIFRTGRAVKDGSLSVFDATGNLVRKVSVSDRSAGAAQRTIGSWDLKDSKGRAVSEGTYLVKGTVTTLDGKRERVSLKVGVR